MADGGELPSGRGADVMVTDPYRYLSVCAGIEAFTVAT